MSLPTIQESFAVAEKTVPVDTTDPDAICARLGLIEDELANVQVKLSRAAYWTEKLSGDIKLMGKVLYAKTTGTIPEREAAVLALLMGDGKNLPEKLVNAEAERKRYDVDFKALDSRRSILQSLLKRHMAEQEPRFGQGSHHR